MLSNDAPKKRPATPPIDTTKSSDDSTTFRTYCILGEFNIIIRTDAVDPSIVYSTFLRNYFDTQILAPEQSESLEAIKSTHCH